MKPALLRPTYYSRLLSELIVFLGNPRSAQSRTKTAKEKIRDTVGLFVIKFALLVIFALLMALMSPVFDPENISKSNLAQRLTPFMLLLVAGFALPLLEELGFRLSLRFRPVYLAISSAVFSYYFLTKIVFRTSNSLIDESFWVRVTVSLAIGALIFPVVRIRSVSLSLGAFWNRNFRWIFYFSCISFAFVHLFNYELTLLNVLLMPLLTMPQILSGVIYGYTRVAFGFQYPLVTHCANNVIFVVLASVAGDDVFF